MTLRIFIWSWVGCGVVAVAASSGCGPRDAGTIDLEGTKTSRVMLSPGRFDSVPTQAKGRPGRTPSKAQSSSR